MSFANFIKERIYLFIKNQYQYVKKTINVLTTTIYASTKDPFFSLKAKINNFPLNIIMLLTIGGMVFSWFKFGLNTALFIGVIGGIVETSRRIILKFQSLTYFIKNIFQNAYESPEYVKETLEKVKKSKDETTQTYKRTDELNARTADRAQNIRVKMQDIENTDAKSSETYFQVTEEIEKNRAKLEKISNISNQTTEIVTKVNIATRDFNQTVSLVNNINKEIKDKQQQIKESLPELTRNISSNLVQAKFVDERMDALPLKLEDIHKTMENIATALKSAKVSLDANEKKQSANDRSIANIKHKAESIENSQAFIGNNFESLYAKVNKLSTSIDQAIARSQKLLERQKQRNHGAGRRENYSLLNVFSSPYDLTLFSQEHRKPFTIARIHNTRSFRFI